MSFKRPHRPDDEDVEAWLMTFADMTTLLLCFFVLLFAMSSPDTTQFKKVAEALREQGFYNDAVPIEDPYDKLKKELSMSLGASGYDQFMAVSEQDKVIALELSSSAFFEKGSAKFSPEAIPMLNLIEQHLLPLKLEKIMVSVEGHTDDSPAQSEQYPSNWELSSGRASNVVRFLIAKEFPADKLRAVGYGDTKPKAPNRDARGNPIPANQELNRRVVVRLLREDGR
jgi:chemotaxis protein MotB